MSVTELDKVIRELAGRSPKGIERTQGQRVALRCVPEQLSGTRRGRWHPAAAPSGRSGELAILRVGLGARDGAAGVRISNDVSRSAVKADL
jgi:hypothetical protein